MPKLLFCVIAAIALWAVPTSDSLSEPKYKWMAPIWADSTCIGDVSTPVCAVETFKACFARRDPSLCALAGLDDMLFKPSDEPFVYRYQIVDVLPITAKRIEEEFDGADWLQPGYVEVRMLSLPCRIGESCGSWSPARVVYYMKPVDERWLLAGWVYMESEQCDYVDPTGKWDRECRLYVYQQNLPWVYDWLRE